MREEYHEVVSYNVRGIRRRHKRREIKELVRKEKIDLIIGN